MDLFAILKSGTRARGRVNSSPRLSVLLLQVLLQQISIQVTERAVFKQQQTRKQYTTSPAN